MKQRVLRPGPGIPLEPFSNDRTRLSNPSDVDNGAQNASQPGRQDGSAVGHQAPQLAQLPPRPRARGQKPMVAMSFRISRQDWERLHLLAMTDGVSINTLTLRGLSKLFEERGLPGITVG
jgi:hypothetical protein